MNDLIHADVFFIITSAITLVVGVLVALALVYIVRILKNVRDISEIVRHEAGRISEDIATLREKAAQGASAMTIFGAVKNIFMGRKKSAKK